MPPPPWSYQTSRGIVGRLEKFSEILFSKSLSLISTSTSEGWTVHSKPPFSLIPFISLNSLFYILPIHPPPICSRVVSRVWWQMINKNFENLPGVYDTVSDVGKRYFGHEGTPRLDLKKWPKFTTWYETAYKPIHDVYIWAHMLIRVPSSPKYLWAFGQFASKILTPHRILQYSPF